jgi:hypothetical protein
VKNGDLPRQARDEHFEKNQMQLGVAGNKTGVDWTEFSMDKLFFRELQFDAAAGLTNLSAFIPDYLVVNIGTNDGAMIENDAAKWEQIYLGVLRKLRAAWPETWFLLGCAPWTSYATEIQSVIQVRHPFFVSSQI